MKLERKDGKNSQRSVKGDRNQGEYTDVIQVRDLIIANLGVFWVSGNDEFMTSGYRDL